MKPAPNDTSSSSEPGRSALLDGLIDRERDRRGRGVAVPIDVDHHLVHRHAGVLGGGLDDANVGLVRHQQIDLVRRQPARVRAWSHASLMRAHGGLEDLAARHPDELRRAVDHRVADRIGGTAAGPVQQVAQRPSD